MNIIMARERKCSCLFFIVVTLCITAAIAAKIGPAASRSRPSKPIANGTIITTRFGGDGSVKEQCQCTDYWLCDADKVYEDPDDPSPCGGSNLVCCKIPYVPEPLPSFETGGSQTCPDGVCVDQNQCVNYGAGKIDLRLSSCPETKLCCPFTDLIKTETTKPPVDYTSVEPPKASCECVAIDRCATYGSGILQMRISKCHQNEICCQPEDILVPSHPVEPSKTFACGYKKGDPIVSRISNTATNDVAEFGEFPWMTLILKKEGDQIDVVCGASLISPSLILTAAHCVEKSDKDSLIIRVGEYDTYLPPEYEPSPHEDGFIAEIYIHNHYKADVAFNDLALIKVKKPFKLRENVVPICTAVSGAEFGLGDIYDPSRCFATGWGKDAYSKAASYSKILKKVDLMLVPKDQCQEQLRKTKLGTTFRLHDSFICAGGQPGKDTCKGDGGGPLICALKNDPTRYVQVGVTSWGIDCAKNYPGVYASLLFNKEWLLTESNIHNIFI